jgi:2-octaprenyl-6-methoxyphenol hydroxylase
MHKDDVFDIAICGAGLNGLAAALALGGPGNRTPLQVALVDARDPTLAQKPGFDGRASAITQAARRMFEAMEVWDAIAPHTEPMREIIVTDGKTDGPRPALLNFGAEHQPGGPSAYMVENRHLLAALYEAVQAAPQITFKTGQKVERFSFTGPHAALHLASGETVAARLCVAADGRNSSARQAAGIETIGWAYGQSGIVTTVSHDVPHGGRAEEHFLPSGPFAILPLPGNLSSLVWTEENAEADRLVALDDEAFLAELTRRFGAHLGEVRLAGPRQAWPLGLFIAKSLTAPRLALLGDAAHVVHPIAGLGFNLGLRDAAALADAVMGQFRLGLDPGGPQALQAYERWRRLDTMMVAAATDGLNRLFSNDVEALRFIRDAGLSVVERVDPLKRFFMREAAGLSGHLPRLMTGEPA